MTYINIQTIEFFMGLQWGYFDLFSCSKFLIGTVYPVPHFSIGSHQHALTLEFAQTIRCFWKYPLMQNKKVNQKIFIKKIEKSG
jgi:hypothetical protein